MRSSCCRTINNGYAWQKTQICRSKCVELADFHNKRINNHKTDPDNSGYFKTKLN